MMPGRPTRPSAVAPEPVRGYEEFLEDIKGRIRSVQAPAARVINAELIDVYWQIARKILARQEEELELGRHTCGVVRRLSADLRAAFSSTHGYSEQNLYRMRALAAAWPQGLSYRVRDLPWGHIATLVPKPETREWYAERADSWSCAQLQAHISSGLQSLKTLVNRVDIRYVGPQSRSPLGGLNGRHWRPFLLWQRA